MEEVICKHWPSLSFQSLNNLLGLSEKLSGAAHDLMRVRDEFIRLSVILRRLVNRSAHSRALLFAVNESASCLPAISAYEFGTADDRLIIQSFEGVALSSAFNICLSRFRASLLREHKASTDQRAPMPFHARWGRTIGIFALSGASHLYGWIIGMGGEQGFVALQPLLDMAIVATVWSALLCALLWCRPGLLSRPILGVSLKTELFCGIWVGALPIGFALGSLLPAPFYAVSGAAYIAAFVNVSGIVAGAKMGWVVLRALPGESTA